MESKNNTEVIRADDFVEYFLFPSLDQLSGNDVDEKLNNFSRDVNESVNKFTVDYIWHKEPCQFVPRTPQMRKLLHESNTEDNLPAHLYGLTFYGENIQDEWFIVEILSHLTKIYPHAIGRVYDADGEFILIEAAEVLPNWANSDTCAERVYFHRGRVVLVQGIVPDVQTVPAALKQIRDNMNLYESPDIMTSIEHRFVGSNKSGLLHHACVYLPISAALLLKCNTQLISYAVRAFCNRDPIDLKICRAMKQFPPETRVYTRVTFTKCLYALLTYHNYKPNQRTGWNLPDEKHETYNAHSLGMKLACGLEICASKVQSAQSDIVDNSEGWRLFYKQLTQNGYFGDAVEGSQSFCQRFEVAKQHFLMLSDNHSTYIDVVAREIHTHLKDMDTLNDKFKSQLSSEYDSTMNENEDWLNISQEDFDAMMDQRYGIKKTLQCRAADDCDNEATDLTANLNTFLNRKSDFDGVDFRPMCEEPTDNASGTLNSTNTQNSGNIDFNPDAFQAHLKEMLDFVIPEDNWDSHSDSMSDFDEENIERNIDMMTGARNTSLSAYMEQMDRELAATTIGSSFKNKAAANATGDDEDFDDIEDFEPVDIDVNALKNLAESYKAQFGNHGPTSSLLNSIGIRLAEENNSQNHSDLSNETP